MSSILKALKKLESTSPASQGRGAPSPLVECDSGAQAILRRTRAGWWIGLGLMGLAALLGAALVGGWSWRSAATSAQGRRASVPTPEARPVITGFARGYEPLVPRRTSLPLKPPPPLRADAFPSDAVSAAAPVGRPQDVQPPRSVPAGPAEVNPGEVLPGVRPLPSVTAAPSAGVGEALPDNASGRSPLPQRPALIDDPGLKLQAIAWSANPTERIAVVNSSILREGDAVEGYRVVRINRDDVVLRGGGGEGRLLFGAK